MFEPCPCGAGPTYLACCGRLHVGQAEAESPEALMRARYSAYVKADAAYLLKTWAHETRPKRLGDLAARRWLGLTVHEARAEGEAGVVRFTARFEGGALSETSRFRRVGGRWVYVDGDVG